LNVGPLGRFASANLLNTPQRFPLTSFFVLAYIWTWVCWWSVVAVSSGHLSLAFPKERLATCGQFGPFAAGLVVTWTADGRAGLREFFTRLLRWRAGPVWLGVSLLLLPATMLLAIVLFASTHSTLATLRFRDHWTTLPAHFVFLLLLGGALGEEPGWSGFALPRLQGRYGSLWASLWLGVLRAGWHLPLWWMYPAPCPYPLFVAGAVLLQFLTTWLFNHTRGSVLYILIFHASLSVASVRLPDVPAYHLWVLCLLAVVLLILLCDRRLRLTPYASHAA